MGELDAKLVKSIEDANTTLAMLVWRRGGLVQWLKLPAWKVGNRGFVLGSGIQVQRNKMFLHCSVVKIQHCEKPPWPRRARPQTAMARILNPVSWEQCHLIHLTILRRFSRLSSAYNYVHKGDLKLYWFIVWRVCRMLINSSSRRQGLLSERWVNCTGFVRRAIYIAKSGQNFIYIWLLFLF